MMERRMAALFSLLTLVHIFYLLGSLQAAPASTSPPPVQTQFINIGLFDMSESGNELYRYNVTRKQNIKLVCAGLHEIPSGSGTTWLKNGKELSDELIFPRTNRHKYYLTIHQIKKEDAGEYTCEVRDDAVKPPRITRLINLNVLPMHRPVSQEVVHKTPGLQNVSSLIPNPNSALPSNDYDLLSNEDEDDYYDDEEERTLQEQDRIDSCETVLKSKDKNEPYICIDFTLKKPMTHYLVRNAGATIQINCNAKGNPTPTITWYKDGVPFIGFGYNHVIQKNSILLKESNQNDAAVYTCNITSPRLTTPIIYSTRLEITEDYSGPPILFRRYHNMTVQTGTSLVLRCLYYSGDMLNVLYETAKTDFLPVDDFQDDLEGTFQFFEMLENFTVKSRTNETDLALDSHVLVLDNVTQADEGWYSCLVGNTVGRAWTSAYISVVEDRTEVSSPKLENASMNPEHLSIYSAIAYAGGAVVLIFSIFGFLLFWWYRFNKIRLRELEAKKIPLGWTKQIVIERRPANDNDEGSILIPEVNIKSIESSKPGQEYELPMDHYWEFPREKLILGKKIGEGAFGEVWLGQADAIAEKDVISTVAVKSLKKTHTDAEMIDLISEMETMKELGKHVNIINLLGCCTQAGELLVIMEYCEQGNLRDHLRNNRHQFMYEIPKLVPIPNKENELNFRDLMSFAFQVARGMDYLVQRKYVHRDLAARNVLVASGKVVKIADFGMTRSTFTSDYYRKKSDGRVPVKWMAPETLFHRIYTTQSDVWSYGILLWEIVTLGGTPYPSMPDVNKLLDFLKSGRRMVQPSNCPDELYMIMRDCWFEVPGARPSFSQLAEDIERILHIAAGTEYMDMEGVRPLEEVATPESSPENSASGFIAFDPDFLQHVLEHGLESSPYC